jgi:hypothetical protein
MRDTIIFYLQNIRFINDLWIIFYPYIFNPINDIYFCVSGLIIILLQCIFKGEDILSYIEKKMIDPSYNLGENINKHPYYDVYYIHNGIDYSIIKDIFWLITIFILIFYRKNHKYVKFGLVIMILFVFYSKFLDFIKKYK